MNPFNGLRRLAHAHLRPEQRRFVKFVIVGTSGVPVNLGTVFVATQVLKASRFAALRDLLSVRFDQPNLTADGVRDGVAYLLGIALSILTNFLLNNAWTWGDRPAGDGARFLRRLVKFYLVSTVAAVVQLATSTVLSAWMRGSEVFSLPIAGEYRLYHAVAPLAGIAIGLGINFGMNNLWTFRKRAQAGAVPPAGRRDTAG